MRYFNLFTYSHRVHKRLFRETILQIFCEGTNYSPQQQKFVRHLEMLRLYNLKQNL